MEKFGAYADRATGRMPFVEELPDTASMPALKRAYAVMRGRVFSPALLALRLPLLALVMGFWALWSLLPGPVRSLGDSFFARLCLACFGCYKIDVCRCTRSDRFVRDAPDVPARAVIAGHLTSPLDILVFTYAFRPLLVLLPHHLMSADGRPSPSSPGRLFTPFMAFVRSCRFDLLLHSPLTAVERDLERSRTGYTEKSSRSVFHPAGGLELSASDALEARHVLGEAEECSRLLVFPENCFSAGSVVLSSLLPDSLIAQRDVVCVSVERPWVYRALAHPFPTLGTTLRDLGEPVANVRVSALVLAPSAGGMARVTKHVALTAGVPVASLTILDREAFYQKNVFQGSGGQGRRANEPETPGGADSGSWPEETRQGKGRYQKAKSY